MSVYVLPHSVTANGIKCYATGNGRIIWTYKNKERSANLVRERMNWRCSHEPKRSTQKAPKQPFKQGETEEIVC